MLGNVAPLAYPSIHVHLLEVVSVLQVLYCSHDAFHGSDIPALCLLRLAERRVPREVVIYFGQRHKRYDVGALNGDTPSEILETDIAREYFVDSLEVQGEGPDEAFGGLGPVRSGCGYIEVLARANACNTVGAYLVYSRTRSKTER